MQGLGIDWATTWSY